MKFVCDYFKGAQLFFAMLSIFVVTTYCDDSDNYIHIDYIKKKYPEIDIYALKAQAIHDDKTASPCLHIKRSDKIERWLQAISTKYPPITGGSNVTFGVPYYIFVPYAIFNTALIYWILKR